MVRGLLTHGLKNTTDLLFRRQASITSAAIIIIMLSLASRVLGVVRYRVLAGEFGSDSIELAAFLAAFRIPDILFQVLVMGALATAFIPVVTGYITKREDREAWKIFSVVVTYALIITAAFSLLVFAFADTVAREFLVPGLKDQPGTIALVANITRVLMLAQFFLITSNFVTGVLNSYNRFLLPALAPVIYNVGIIFGTVFLSGTLGIYGPVVGVLLGALGHLLIQLPLMGRIGVRFSFNLNHRIPGVREVGRLMTPRAFGLAVAQIDAFADTALASLVTSAAAATNIIVLGYAFALQALPAGVFGYALGSASLPTLAKEFAQENLENFKSTFISSLHQILYLVIPTVVILIVLRIPIVRLIYGAPSFDWEATKLTAFTLAAFSLGIVAQASIQLLARAFYALLDTKTPVKIAILAVVLNIVGSVTLIYFFNNVAVLGLSASIAATVDAVLLLYFLSKRVGGFDWRAVLWSPFKMGLAGLLAGVALYTPLKVLDAASHGQLWLNGSLVNTFFGPWAIDTSHTPGLLLLTIISATMGLLVYFLLTYLLGIEEIAVFAKMFEKAKAVSFRRQKLDEAAASAPLGNEGGQTPHSP